MKTVSYPAAIAALICLSGGIVAWTLDDQPAEPALRVISEQEVPAAPSEALNVRWAGEQSLYLARLHHGVTEVALDGKLTPLRQPVPDRATLHVLLNSFARLAVSPQYFVVSSNYSDYGFRPRSPVTGGLYKFTWIQSSGIGGIDLVEDRLLLLGDPTPRTADTLGLSGAVGWIGKLGDHPEKDLKPFLFDVAGSPPKGLLNCMFLEMGAVRFLPDGSYLVVPGFQEGVHLYSAAGALLKTWRNEAVGLDSPDCAGMDLHQAQLLAVSNPARFDYLNHLRVLEEILPLPEGPGLLIRSVAKGTVQWTLNVLHGDQVIHYPVPITGNPPYDRLRADVRGHRILFLRAWCGFRAAPTPPPGHLYLAELTLPDTKAAKAVGK